MGVDLVDTTTSDASPHILVHPLALISINDHVTRSGIRHHGPIIGALLGRHNGKEIVIEQSFEVGSLKLLKNGSGIDETWFGRMIQLQSEIYPTLSLVGWYTVGQEPQSWHISFQTQLRSSFECDSPIFLLYQPQTLQNSDSNGPLPLAVYEGIPSQAQAQDGGNMDVDYPDGQAGVRFRTISYSLETPADEAICLADIMQGAGVASAVSGTEQTSKKRVQSKDEDKSKESLTAEEDELLATIRTKANAIKMLQSRLDLIAAYLKSQPSSYLTDPSISPADSSGKLDHEVLRSIAALAAELKLTSTNDLVEFAKETEQFTTDSKVLELLANMTQNAGEIKLLGKRVHAAEPRRRKEAYASNSGLEGMVGSDWT